ncbi:MAG: hypothetical protein JNM66_05380 [Bryobacterales bacterium]|nr:hypothetical protein [Bryobacterales bacterium]
MPELQFGEHAIYTPENHARFLAHRDSVIESIKPATYIESILTDELLHASWEMQRVRDNSANTAAESRLNAANSRASRNWHRSLKQLKRLQSARAAHITTFHYPRQQELLTRTPLAEVHRMPKPFEIPSYVTPEEK